MIGRREFLRGSAVALGAGWLGHRMASPVLSRVFADAAATPSKIDVMLGEPIGTIAPEIYGHFIEHLGGVIYDGIWVGEGSRVPNVHGIRKALIDDLAAIHAPVIRWPGGCFADSYDWKDGIGPRGSRPRRTDFWANEAQLRDKGNVPQAYEPNLFGTNEFIEMCRAAGAEPYLAANIRSLPALDFDHWVEYCNSPAGSTSLAQARAAAGFPDPFNVKFWGVGNETWGCGGDFTPEEYAAEFLRFTAWIPRFGVPVSLVASGPNGDDIDWTRQFLERLVARGKNHLNSVYGLSMHHYASLNLATPPAPAQKSDALQFDEAGWFDLLKAGDKTGDYIEDHWKAMGELDTDHKIRLVVDEWGPWYGSGTEALPTDLFGQQSTLRDAVFSAATLDIFNRNPEKVAMAATAQLVNCLNSLFIAHGDKLVRTPVYHVFAMYAAHQAGQAVRAEFSSPDVSYQSAGKDASFWGLKGSASVKGKELLLTVVNPDVHNARETEIDLGGAAVKSVRATTLTSGDIHAHNTFESPDAVKPASQDVPQAGAAGATMNYTFPAASVTALQITLT
jgi:alpha-N-arabinofuranosidase